MLIETARNNVRKLVDAYAVKTGESVPAISKKVYGNRAFLKAFLAGEKSITLDKLEAMTLAFWARWPDGLSRPRLTPLPHNAVK